MSSDKEGEDKLKALRAAIEAGRRSGPPVPAEEVFAALERRYGAPPPK